MCKGTVIFQMHQCSAHKTGVQILQVGDSW